MLKEVQEALSGGAWNFQTKEDKLILSVDTGDSNFYISMGVSDEQKTLEMLTYFDIECPKKYRPEMCKMLVVANKRLEMGGLEMEYDDCVIAYKRYTLLMGVTMSTQYIDTLIHETVKQAKALRFAIEAICRGEKCENALLFID